MLVTAKRNSCLTTHMNIFYKRGKYLQLMNITGPTSPKEQTVEQLEFSKYYIKFLERQALDDKADHVGERYTFVNLTVSLLESLMKSRIESNIQHNWEDYKSTWRTLSLESKYTDDLLNEETLPESVTPKDISCVISRSFSYQSIKALNFLLNNLSFIENFFDYHLEKTSVKKPTFNKKPIEKLLELRNDSTHNLKDYKISENKEIKEIQHDLANVISEILNIVTKSFEARNILFKKKITDKSDKEKLLKQIERMNKILSALDVGFCKKCTWDTKKNCKYCINIPSVYFSNKQKSFKEELEIQINQLGKLMKGL